ncbi:unnamed protein product [marine sediment metagenome]|uniref:PIN domain-containing protein n=1 Tax=marine sediment metagenome TaxID=412755 RepID=X1UUN0_9ZZZZ
MSLGELQKGIGKLDEGKKRHKLQSWFDHDLRRRFSGRILTIDEEVACRWGQLSGEAEKQGRKVPILDGLLAATALAYGLTVVTRNTEDMKVTGAKLFNPWGIDI